MKKIITGAFALIVGVAYADAIFTDLSSTATTGSAVSGTVTASKNYTDAWVVVGYSQDNNTAVTGASFNSGALTSVSSGVYDGMGYGMWYANVGALSSGSGYDVSVSTTTTTKYGLGVWLVDDVTGVVDTGISLARDDENGGNGGDSRSFGFNLNPAISPVEVTTQTFDELDNGAGNLILQWAASGAASTQYANPAWINATGDLDMTDVVGGGGSYGASQMIAGSGNQEIGISLDRLDNFGNSWYRVANTSIAFTAIPEPSTFMLLVGGLGFWVYARRRKR